MDTEKDEILGAWAIPFGDSKTIELEMARHKVLLNDLAANQNSVDILNEAGHGIMEAGAGTEDASTTHALLLDLEQKWESCCKRPNLKQSLLEERLKEAESFQDEIQDKLNWLSEMDQHLIASKPVGGLPQSAKDQLHNFMDLFGEIEANKPVIESILKRANDRKIKLEIAVRDAVEFYDTLQSFTLWLGNAEKSLSGAKAPSRIMDVVLQQIEEHKAFQDDIGDHLPAQNALDKKGTTLKYFSQKQDVAQIKNLLASVQQRWDKLISASADRQRSLNSAHMEGKEFSRHYADMLEWLDGAEQSLDHSVAVPSDAEKIRAHPAQAQGLPEAADG
ncbi:Dystonin [Hypsibius exemplaris]|uniref:Dystonin n=1 Tax=Hypsibius exemplaris TaxID=2072580 RepID=A0A9X6NPY8_HYPEX|nr:Dystonin [Hypsibius exemplaris]